MISKPEESLPRYVSPPTMAQNHGANITRSNSTASRQSGWTEPSQYTHENRQAQLHQAILNHGRGERDVDSRSSTPAPSHPPFKSSQTAFWCHPEMTRTYSWPSPALIAGTDFTNNGQSFTRPLTPNLLHLQHM